MERRRGGVSTTAVLASTVNCSPPSSSDDDDPAAVARPSTMIVDGCPASVKTSTSPSLRKQVTDNNGDKDSSSSSNNEDVAAASTPTSIGGRLTFYKDGKFIFQLAAHHQQQPYDNQSAVTSPCRWVPVPTVIQQHKNSVKSIGEWSHHQQNKTIWPYLVTNPINDSKSPQSFPKTLLPIVRIGERKQQYQQRIKTPPLLPNACAVDVAAPNGSVVMATTTNIIRRPSRKCSTTAIAENIDLQHRQSQSHLRPLSRRLQQHQHQSFMMVATEAIKAQRRLLSIPKMKRHRRRKTTIAMNRDPLLQEQHQPLVNLDTVVRNLWGRRHTTELLVRRQLLLKKNVDLVAAPDTRNATVTTVDSTCTNTGSVKRRSVFSPLPATSTTTTMTNSNMSITSNSSPHKKYRPGQQQQRRVVDKCMKKAISTSPSLPQTASSNDHSITAILSGAAGAKRSNGGVFPTVVDPESNIITSSTKNAIITPQKNSPAPISLLRTLLKSPSGENGPLPIVASSNGSDALHQIHHPVTAAAEQLAAAGYFNVLYHQAAIAAAMAYQTHTQLPKSQPPPLFSSQFPPNVGANISWQRRLNRPPFIPPLEVIGSNGVSTVSSSASRIVAPYSSNGIKKRTMAMGASEYCSSIDGNNLAVVDEESSSSADCVPLNLSKDSVVENVGGTTTTATVR